MGSSGDGSVGVFADRETSGAVYFVSSSLLSSLLAFPSFSSAVIPFPVGSGCNGGTCGNFVSDAALSLCFSAPSCACLVSNTRTLSSCTVLTFDPRGTFLSFSASLMRSSFSASLLELDLGVPTRGFFSDGSARLSGCSEISIKKTHTPRPHTHSHTYTHTQAISIRRTTIAHSS